jgi:hypothetical protein
MLMRAGTNAAIRSWTMKKGPAVIATGPSDYV